MNDKAVLLLTLLKCKGIGNSKVLKFIYENKMDFENCKKNIDKLVSLDEFENNKIKATDEVNRNIENGINIYTIFEKEYPSKLYTISDPILYLYFRGNLKLLDEPSIAVIGTRLPSDWSVKQASHVCEILCENNYTIVSGLALGTDSIAHKSTLENHGKTIAVLPSSIDNIMPKSNSDLANQILMNNGLIVSEYPVGSVFNNFNYAKRDRIQSALSNLIIVTEATENSGTMIAVNKSYHENKPVVQLKLNNNIKIRESIEIDDTMVLKIKSLVKNDIEKEKRKSQKILESYNSNQLTLF